MLEKIMDLQILLYSMAALGTLGAIGMLTTNLTYRRMLKSTGSKNTGTKNTQGAGSSQRISLKEKWLIRWLLPVPWVFFAPVVLLPVLFSILL